ncbi:MAG: hypothetical protein KFF77_11025 [Bacteroidetes bacterium]|nr:hypothetical protein [Bacteroidota bacterium]
MTSSNTFQHALCGMLLLLLVFALPSCGSSDEKPLMETADSVAVETAAPAPMQPDEEHRIDIGRWREMTRADFNTQFADFARSEPPVIRDYSICDSITCHFPSKTADALPEVLVCDLNGVYMVADAFKLMGIEIGEIGNTSDAWISVESRDNRFAALQYKAAGSHPDRTRQILLQFNRTGTD